MRKDNRIIEVEESRKEEMLKRGYDVIDAKTGKITERAKGGSSVDVAAFNRVAEERDNLKEKLENVDSKFATYEEHLKEVTASRDDALAQLEEQKKENTKLKSENTRLKNQK